MSKAARVVGLLWLYLAVFALVQASSLRPKAVCAAPDVEGQPVAKVAVTKCQFTGNTVFTESTLAGHLATAVGQEFTLAEMRALAGKVEELYASHGYSNVRVVLPEQDVSEGILRFQVVEPKVGEVRIVGNERYSEGFLRSRIGGAEGSLLNVGAVERSLLLLNENQGLTTKASLQPGGSPGTTDILVTVQEAPKLVEAVTEFNTFGSRFASRERVSQTISLGNVSGHGDSLSLGVVTAPSPSDLLFGQIRYTVPLGSNGTRLNLYGLAGDFEVGQEFAVLGLEGNGRTFGASIVHPIVKTRTRSLLTEVGLDLTNSELELLGQRNSYDKIRSARLGFTLDQLDPGDQARTLVSVYVHQGLGDNLGAMASNDPFSSRLGADNSFTKVIVDLARVQQLDERSYLIARLGGQLANDPLVAAEQFDVGGADSVRGYRQSEFLGDSGLRASLELRHTPRLSGPDWLEDFQTALFIDHGRISNKSPVPGQPKSESVTGVGFGFRAEVRGGFFFRADLGYALSDEATQGGRFQPYFQVLRRY